MHFLLKLLITHLHGSMLLPNSSNVYLLLLFLVVQPCDIDPDQRCGGRGICQTDNSCSCLRYRDFSGEQCSDGETYYSKTLPASRHFSSIKTAIFNV